MKTSLRVSPNRKADHTVAGEMVMNVRDLLTEEMTMQERIDLLKTGISALNTRLNLRAENRKDAQTQMLIDEHNARFQSNIKILNIELKDID